MIKPVESKLKERFSIYWDLAFSWVSQGLIIFKVMDVFVIGCVNFFDFCFATRPAVLVAAIIFCFVLSVPIFVLPMLMMNSASSKA